MKLSKRAEKLRDEVVKRYGLSIDMPESYQVTASTHCTHGYNAGYSAARLEAKVLEEVVEQWIEWENEQIKKEGPYVGEAITKLIANAKDALKKYREEKE